MNQLASWYYIFAAISLLFCSFMLSKEPQRPSSLVTVYCNNTVNARVIEKLINQPIILQRVTFNADIYFQKNEFLYLTELVSGELIDSSHLIKAVEFLGKKNKFSTITVYADFSDGEISLHFSLHSFLTFKKVKIHG